MKKEQNEKTNVVRVLEAAGISFRTYFCENAEGLSGTEVARAQGQDEEQTFKTLVTVGKSKMNYVFVIPVSSELDLKKAAGAVGEKNIEMIKAKELLPLTGYVHGGCSPIGMKKQLKTVLNETAMLFDTILFSAGKIGYQVELAPADLQKMIPFTYRDLCV